MSDALRHAAGPEHRLERLVFFSDAVFAIAITLLIIEIHPPHLHTNVAHAHIDALAGLAPEFMGFVISFFVIGAFWTGHHRVFALAHRWSDRLVLPNLVLLCSIVAMPFFTAYMSANPGARVPLVLYTGWMLAAGLANIVLQAAVTRTPVLDPAVDAEQVAAVRRRGVAVALGAASALMLVALLPIPAIGLMGLGTIGLWRPILARGARRA